MTYHREFLTILIILVLTSPIINAQNNSSSKLTEGVWNGYDYSKPASILVDTAKHYGGNAGLIDIVIVQALINGNASLPFSATNVRYTVSTGQNEIVENYLSQFDSSKLKVILSIQPAKADIAELLDLVLSHYGQHSSIIGVNVDTEWKLTEPNNRVSNEERDIWMNLIKKVRPDLKLFLTGFGDSRYFPKDTSDLVILYDAANATQTAILNNYGALSKNYTSVGIYTGYYSSVPPSASRESILSAAPNTSYIIHTDDIYSEKQILMFELDNIQSGWIEQTTISLLDLHINKNIPLICGVIPDNLTTSGVGTGVLIKQLKNIDTNYRYLFEVSQEGYTARTGELKGRSYEEQKSSIKDGLTIFSSIGITPETFIPALGEADVITVNAAADLGFKRFVNSYENVSTDKLLILGNSVSLTDIVGNVTRFRSLHNVTDEIGRLAGKNAIILRYEVNIFQNNTTEQTRTLSDLIDTLKSSEKYVFMTPREYQELISKFSNSPTENPWQDIGRFYPYGVSILIIVVVITFYYRRLEVKQNRELTE